MKRGFGLGRNLRLNLYLSLLTVLVALGRKDRMNPFPFIHQAEAVCLDLLSLPVESEEVEKAFQLHPDHLGQRFPLAAAFHRFDGITEDIVVVGFHSVYFTLFEEGIQREAVSRN